MFVRQTYIRDGQNNEALDRIGIKLYVLAALKEH